MCGHAAGATGETSCNCSSLGRICSQTPRVFLPVVQGESKLWCSPGMVCAHCQFLAPPPGAWQQPGLMARDLKGSKCGGYSTEPPPSITGHSLPSNTLHTGLISHLI